MGASPGASDDLSKPPESRARVLLEFLSAYGAIGPFTAFEIIKRADTVTLNPLPSAILDAPALDIVLTLNGSLTTDQTDLVDSQCEAWVDIS